MPQEKFRRSIVIADITPAADGVLTYDMPPRPISFIDLTIKCLNVTNEATDAEIAAMVTKVEVLDQGRAVVSMSFADLLAHSAFLSGNQPILTNQVATDNATRSITARIHLGRVAYNPDECYPARDKGQLQLQLTVDIANAGADGLILQAECVELIGAKPKSYLKSTALSSTPTATGDHDVNLPVGNWLAGILLWGTTVPTGIAWTTTIDKIKLLVDNTEFAYPSSYWECLHGALIECIGMNKGWVLAAGDDNFINYALVQLSPYGMNDTLMWTGDTNSIVLRITAGDTNPLRVIPMEVVPIAEA